MRCRRCAIVLALVALSTLSSCTAKRAGGLQAQDTWKVSLPKGSQPEGIAAGSDNDLWVACLSGNIIHVVSGCWYCRVLRPRCLFQWPGQTRGPIH